MPAKKVAKKQNKTEKQTMIDFGTSVSRFWKKYFDFKGIAQRGEYWFAFLFVWLVSLLLFGFMSEQGVISDIASIMYLFWIVAIFVPRLSIAARRLHDAGFSAWWLLITQPLGIVVMSFLLPWLLFMGTDGGYTVLILAAVWGSLLYGYELPLIIIGFLPSRLKNNKYRK